MTGTNNNEAVETAKTIRFMDKELKVATEPYAYLQNQATGRVVLKFSVREEDATFDEIAELKGNMGDIAYLEDGIQKNVFEGHTCGSGGFVCNYAGGTYSVELRRKDANTAAIEQNAADIAYLALMSGVEM